MSPEEEAPSRLDRLGPRLWVSGRKALHEPPAPGATAINLSRAQRSLHPSLHTLQRPFAYWLDPEPDKQLEERIAEAGALMRRGPVVVHCHLGLDRTGIVALALLAEEHEDARAALRCYQRARSVRLPRGDAWALLCRWAERHGLSFSAACQASTLGET